MKSRLRGLMACAWALCAAACGGRGGRPPEVPALIKGPDGREYRLIERGRYKAYYDAWGRLERIEYDQNGDGRTDHIAHHDGAKSPRLIEIDEDFDGSIDRWEDYDAAGTLVKVGASRRGRGPDVWSFPGPDSLPARKEYDDDGDGRIDRVEILQAGRIARVELDADRDGRIDRWQEWRDGRLVSEDLDTDRDGRPDRRLHYTSSGGVARLERLAR
jgi:hypothetical protein